jgi:hypothetical protein
MTQSRSALAEQARELRRHSILELLSTGYTNHREIADKLNLKIRTVYRDVQYIKENAKQTIRKHIEEVMPLEHQKCMVGTEQTIYDCTRIIRKDGTETKDVLAALAVRLQAYRFKAELIDGESVVNGCLEFIEEQKSKNIPQDKTDQNGKVPIDDISKDA